MTVQAARDGFACERSAALSSRDQGNLAGKRILIANHQFIGFTGSDIHYLQRAQHFISRGAEATSYGYRTSEKIMTEIERLVCRFVVSGRSVPTKRTAQQLVKDIRSGYAAAVGAAQVMRKGAA